jgi:Ca-activated chloride channel family protein
VTPAALPEPALAFSFLGYALRLAEPGALRLLLAVGALGALGAVALVRRRRALTRAAGALAPRIAPGANRSRPAARLGLSLLGLALLALALSRPQCGTRTELTRRYGVDLAVVLDASRSMLAADVKPDRLSRAKLELGALLDGLGGDRVGLVVFAGDAFVACPLTTDHAAAKLFLRAVEPDQMPRQGTALARALAAAREMLLASSGGGGARARVVLVVSDGEDHEGGTASAAKVLAQEGVRIFALAVGTAAGAPVPPREGARERANPVLTRLDLASLGLLADTGDGEVYGLSAPDRGLAAFRAALDRMERSEVEGRLTVTYEDRYALAAFPGFLLLLASLLVREGRRPASPASRGAGAGAGGALLALLLLGFSPFQAEEENVRAGNERLRAGDPAGARRAYDAAERAVGPHAEIEFDRGEAAAREGRLEEAKAAWGRAAAGGSPALASRALQNLGTALAVAGDRGGAVKAFSDALARDPSNEDARWNLEVLLRKERERERSGSSGEEASSAGARPPAQAERSGSEGERRPRAGEARAGEEPAGAARPPEGKEERAGRERREGEAGARREPLSRQETEALLDALRARERNMPFFGRERPSGRRPDAAKDW